MRHLPLFVVLAACKGPTAPFPDTDTDVVEETDVPPPADTDGDGLTDDIDNCRQDANADQADLDLDGYGDACDVDVDGDQIPDEFDLFPLDPNRPGTALDDTAYAHTATQLFSFGVDSHIVTPIGTPNVDAGILTDIAIDRYGVLYAITFDDLYVCHPQTAECWFLGALPSSSNGLSFLPQGTLLADRDALVGIAQDGTWSLLTVTGATVQTSTVGGYGGTWESSGDVFSVLGTGTFAAIDQGGDVVIAEVDPTNGALIRQVVQVPYGEIYGIAGWDGVIFAFDASGDILTIDPDTGAWSVLTTYAAAWYGAGVRTETALPTI
ncbi:MAG: thrombospondin type 3 repeat-containing protein [Myxococcota bacterium]